jgi:hypothetical protein
MSTKAGQAHFRMWPFSKRRPATAPLTGLIADVVALVPRESARPPLRAPELVAFERERRTVLPEDVRTFYSTCDGFDQPTDLDHGWIQLWPLADWSPTSRPTFMLTGTSSPRNSG